MERQAVRAAEKAYRSLCFIPDSDPPKEGEPYGPGFVAVMDNGKRAVQLGFDVTVRQLPADFRDVYVPLFDFEIEALEADGISDFERRRKIATVGKQDADSYILSKEIHSSIEEKPFVVWLADKRFATADSPRGAAQVRGRDSGASASRQDALVLDTCIEQLAKIHGKVKLWRDALTRSKGRRGRKPQPRRRMNRERDIELLRQYNLTIRDNCYFTFDGDDEPTRSPLSYSNRFTIFRTKGTAPV